MLHRSFLSFCILITASLLLVLSACQQESPGTVPPSNARFFDLKAYFQQEAKTLSAQQPEVIKRLEIDGKTEEQQPKNLDFNDELRLFTDADINRPAWLDKYSVDSLLDNGHLKRLSYKALEEDLKTRELQIDFQNDKVSEIHILKKFDTAIASTEQKLDYYPGKGYSINNRQKTVMQDPQLFKVEVLFQ